MSKIKRLVTAYGKFIAIPWKTDAAAAQRVIFCVYDASEELRLRAKIDEFEIATRQAGHDWVLFDLTDSFPNWLAGQKYAESYFKKPALLTSLIHKYPDHIDSEFKQFLLNREIGDNTVVAVKGTGAIFGFLKAREVVDRLVPMFRGRLLVFFPGSYENNNYRLLDGYDGWNYLAVPLTPDGEY